METQIQELYKPLFLYVRKRINIQEDAEDLTQEVFYKLSKSNSDKIDNVKSWVYTIAKNTITDYYRKKKIHTEEIGEYPEDETYNDNNVVEELSCCIEKYVEQLPKDYSSVMMLSELEEVSQKEIAEQLGMNYTTVRSKIQRGRKKLKDIFTQCCTVKQGMKGSILSYERNQVETCDSKPKCGNVKN